MIKSKKIATSLSCLVLCLLTLCSVFVLSGCGGISIDVKANYLLHPVFSGCNGKGSVELELNYKNVDYAVQSYINNDKYSDIYSLVSDIDFELEDESVNGKLKNDDSFKVITKYDEDKATELGVTFTNTEITCKVQDLKDGTELDAFKDVKVTFSGEDGSGYASVNTDDCKRAVTSNVYFTFEDENNGKLKNGDEVTVKANLYSDDSSYFLKEESKKYKVDGLYGARKSLEGTDLSDVTEEMRKKANTATKSDDSIAYYKYKFNSGKKRELNSYDFSFETKMEFEKYVYAYDPDDISDNTLAGVYKLTTTVKCKNDQLYVSSYNGAEAMKKGDNDTGITYIVVTTSGLIFSSDNKLYDNNMNYDYYRFYDDEFSSRYYDMESCADLNDIKDLFDNNNYVLVNYDENFKELKDAEPSTEKATEKATEKSTEKTTEKSDEKSTEKATTKTSEVSTEKATAKN